MKKRTFDFTKHKCKKIIFTIDSDYLDLVDCIGLDYQKFGTDLKIKTSNCILISNLTKL